MSATTALGIDRLLADPGLLPPGRVGLLANQASLASDWTPTVDAVRRALGDRLAVLLTPEHGYSGLEDDATPVADRHDPHSGLPLLSLYGPRRRPDPEALRSLDVVLVDLQEVGVRCYTYATTLALLLEAAAELDAPPEIVVCDRPNLLGPTVEGPPLDPSRRSFLGYLDVPYQHGLTLGELARAHAERLGGVPLRVLALEGWDRAPPATPAGAFVPPSPGLPDAAAVAAYPGLVLLEGTNLSEGRGTPLPFRLLGGPGLDAEALAERVRALGLPGLRVRPLAFRPDSGKLAGRVCRGVQLHPVDAAAFRPLPAVMRILSSMFAQGEVRWVDCATLPWCRLPGAGAPWFEPVEGPLVDALTGDGSVRAVIEGRLAAESAERSWHRAHLAFLETVEGALLYTGAPRPAGAGRSP